MSRLGITYEEVAQVADALNKKGEAPTIDAIRMQLGTGSFTTISKYLNIWRHGGFSINSVTRAKPDIVLSVAEKVWQDLRAETDAEVDAIKSETQALLNDMQSKLNEALNKVSDQEERHIMLQETFNNMHAAKELLELDFKKTKEERALLQERFDGLEQRYADFQRLTVKHQDDMAESHKKEVNHIYEKAKLQDEAQQRMISEIKTNQEEQRHTLITQIDSLKIHNLKLIKEIENCQLTIRKQNEEIIKIKTENNAISKERDQLSQQISSQTPYWDLFKETNKVTLSILSEVKDIPKFDMSMSSFAYLSSAHNTLGITTQKIDDISNETKAILDKYHNSLLLVTNTEK